VIVASVFKFHPLALPLSSFPTMSPETALHAGLEVVLGEVPVPGLTCAFKLFTFIIVTSVHTARESRKQLHFLAKGVGELLSTLNSEFRESRIVAANCVEPLADLEK
jgi:hypothetical protein